jgi:hypothetical protein
MAKLAFRYSDAALAMDKFQSGRGDADLSLDGVRNFLGKLSPLALEAADRGALKSGQISAPPYISYAKHCVLFLAGALAATYRHGECSRYALQALGKMGNFFKMHDASFKGGEGLAIKASSLEIIAEMLRVHKLPGEDVGFVYPQQILQESARIWLNHMEQNSSGRDRDEIYLRALNAAQWQPDYGLLERAFIMANEGQTEALGSAQFLIRAAWAVLMDESGDRPVGERWDLVSEYIRSAEIHLGGGDVTGGGQLADVASNVRTKSESYAVRLNAFN